MRARGIDEFGERFFAATHESRSTARMSPARRRTRDTVEFYAEAAARIDLAVRNVRVLARGAMRALALDENVPPEVADALEDLGARRAGAWRRRWRAARASTRSASPRCGPPRPPPRCSRARRTCPVSVIVGQIRSTATDLLTGIGLTYEEATEAVREASG